VALPGFGPALARRIPGLQHLGYRIQGRSSEKVIEEIRDKVTSIPGVQVNIGQPISHRLDHIMSGVRAEIAVKAFGEDLRKLREFSHDLLDTIAQVPGVVDLQAEPQVEISQIRLQIKRQEAARYGLSPVLLSENLIRLIKLPWKCCRSFAGLQQRKSLTWTIATSGICCIGGT
jgi:Cu/Ag efflux pump CusA